MTHFPPRRLLLRGVNWLGDAVMTTPALMRLREALPDTQIILLTRAKLADLWTSHPALNEVLRIEPGESLWAVSRKVRVGAFDTALVLPNSPRSALEVWLAGIPRRIGYARPWRNWFLTQVIPTRAGHVTMCKRSETEIRKLVEESSQQGVPCSGDSAVQENQHQRDSAKGGAVSRRSLPTEAHQIYDYLHLAETLGASPKPTPPTLAVREAEVAAALAKFGIPWEGDWIGLNAGAEYGPAKRWPKDRFIAAARTIQQRTGCGCLIFGGPGDTELAEALVSSIQDSRFPCRNVSGRTSLRELMALLKRCRVALTNDTGPMHLAAALGVPVVVPFGSTSPDLTGPGLPGDPRHQLIRSDVPCSPCFLRECPIDFRCMNGLSVERMVAAVMDILTN